LRVGTGEFTDSLMFDEVTGIAEELISSTCRNKKLFLEFKTKSANVDHLLSIKNKGNTVLAWTLNTDQNINLYEAGAATLEERLYAAVRAQNAGYYTAFHFDPVIKYSNFISDYYNVIDTMHKLIKPEGVLWISLGCFRYSHGFKDI
jgi:spore photoproduct lyase